VKKLIRKWLGLEIEIEASRPMVHDVLEGSEMALVAYRIDNGYLLRVSQRNSNTLTIGSGVRLIYCTDERDMAEKIVAHRAFSKIAGTDYTVKTNKY
jgi:hypothetical protein